MLLAELFDPESVRVLSIGPQAPVLDALEFMHQECVGSLVVFEDGELIGIVTERDYASKILLRNRSSKSTVVEDIMTRKVITGDPAMSVDACIALMTEKHIRHLPVLSAGVVVAVLSIRDLMHAIVNDQHAFLNQFDT